MCSRSDIRFQRFCKTRKRLVHRLFLAKPAFADTVANLNAVAASRLRTTHCMDLTPQRDPDKLDSFTKKQVDQRTNAQKILEDTIVEVDV